MFLIKLWDFKFTTLILIKFCNWCFIFNTISNSSTTTSVALVIACARITWCTASTRCKVTVVTTCFNQHHDILTLVYLFWCSLIAWIFALEELPSTIVSLYAFLILQLLLTSSAIFCFFWSRAAGHVATWLPTHCSFLKLFLQPRYLKLSNGCLCSISL